MEMRSTAIGKGPRVFPVMFGLMSQTDIILSSNEILITISTLRGPVASLAVRGLSDPPQFAKGNE